MPWNAGTSSSTVPRSDRKSTRLNSSHSSISYAAFSLKKNRRRLRIHGRFGRHDLFRPVQSRDTRGSHDDPPFDGVLQLANFARLVLAPQLRPLFVVHG